MKSLEMSNNMKTQHMPNNMFIDCSSFTVGFFPSEANKNQICAYERILSNKVS